MAYICCAAIILLPTHIRRAVSSQLEKHKQGNNPLHPLYMSKIQPGRDSKQDIASSTLLNPLMAAHVLEDWPSRVWSSHLQTTTHKLSFSLKETLPPGSSEAWSSLNHLRTGTGRCKAPIQKWGYNEDGRAACDEMIMRHLVVCLILPQPCSHEDLEEFNHRAYLIWPTSELVAKNHTCTKNLTTDYWDHWYLQLNLCDRLELNVVDFWIRNYGLQIRNYELVIRNYGLLIRNYGLLIHNYELLIRNYELAK